MSSLSTNGQLAFRFRESRALPFAVSPRRLSRDLRRGLSVELSVLRQLRAQYRREIRRQGGAAAYATTPAGRRAHRTFETLAERALLCG